MSMSEAKILEMLAQFQSELTLLRTENAGLRSEIQDLKSQVPSPNHVTGSKQPTSSATTTSPNVASSRRSLLKHLGTATAGVLAATALSGNNSVALAETTTRNAITGLGGEDGYGGKFAIKSGGLSQLYLKPSTNTTAPTTGGHQKGEVHVDSNGTLWYCTTDGTPGSWKAVSNSLILQTENTLPATFDTTAIKAPVNTTTKKAVLQVQQLTDTAPTGAATDKRMGIFSIVEGGVPSASAPPSAICGYITDYGTGVQGIAKNTGIGLNGIQGFGVVSYLNEPNGYSAGVYGLSNSNVGVLGESNAGIGVSGAGEYGGKFGTWGSGHLLFTPPTNSSLALPPPAAANKTQTAGTLFMDASGNLWYCVATGTLGGVGTWRKLAGKAPNTSSETYTAGTLHLLQAPDRFLDTRVATMRYGLPSPLQPNTDYSFYLDPTRAGANNRYIPAGATAVLATITTSTVTQAGGIRVVSSAAATATTPGLFWSAVGTTTSGSLTIPLAADRIIKFWTAGTMDVILDITGYYM